MTRAARRGGGTDKGAGTGRSGRRRLRVGRATRMAGGGERSMFRSRARARGHTVGCCIAVASLLHPCCHARRTWRARGCGRASRAREGCNRHATSMQQACNKSATGTQQYAQGCKRINRMQQGCNMDATAMQQGCNSNATAMQQQCNSNATGIQVHAAGMQQGCIRVQQGATGMKQK